MNNKLNSSLVVPHKLPIHLIYRMEAWVALGLLIFWRKNSPTEHDIYQLLCARVQEIYPHQSLEASFYNQDELLADWFSIKQQCLTSIAVPDVESADSEVDFSSVEFEFPLVKFVRDYQLNETQIFLLFLLGFLETNHLVNLAVAELQAPDQLPRITVHLLCAFMNALLADKLLTNRSVHESEQYSALTPLDIAEHPLVLQKIITLSGDAPLPLRRAQIHPNFWSILVGREPLWPCCEKLHLQDERPVSLMQQEQIAHISQLLKQSFTKQYAVIQNDSQQDGSPKDISPHEHRHDFQGVIVRGNPNAGRANFCCRLAMQMQLQAIEVPVKIWQDEPLLGLACRYAHWFPVLRPPEPSAETTPVSIEQINTRYVPLAIIWSLEGSLPLKGMLDVSIDLPTQNERKIIWQSFLQDELLSQQMAAQALLSARSIQFIALNARQLAQQQATAITIAHIAEARRQLGADKLRLLAQPVFRQVTADALVMPTMVEQALEFVVKRSLKRETLWRGLGETLKVTSNPGVRALFVGESGTGKTLAASYIATRLAAPLYRVDLSAVMNKYIGESEKNLAQLLDQAAASDVVLLFDEADALFGNRGDGKETGERFANMLTNFLLTRIETHPGIVILTTNSRERIDNAFTRRLDAIVEFPLPAFEERLHLWRSHFGDRGPGEEIYRTLASYCDLAGGQLRNVVLTALVYADDDRVSAANLVEGLRAEYRKQGREMPKKLEALSS